MSTEIAEAVAAMIAERQAARVADYQQRRGSLAAFVGDKRTRRKAGVDARNAAKLARIRAQERLA